VTVVAAEQEDADQRLVVGWAGRHGLPAGVEQADAAEAGRSGEQGGFLEKIARGGEGRVLPGIKRRGSEAGRFRTARRRSRRARSDEPKIRS
jgi:hypothetical protein